MPDFPPLAHVAITVSDLSASTAWYSALFGSDPVLDEDEASGAFHHTVFALSSGMLFGLHTHGGSPSLGSFDERNTGLDHVAFSCSQDELRVWSERLTDLGVAHDGIKDGHYGSGLSFRDPDNIALEFFAPPA